jgi:hypothetical protein
MNNPTRYDVPQEALLHLINHLMNRVTYFHERVLEAIANAPARMDLIRFHAHLHDETVTLLITAILAWNGVN